MKRTQHITLGLLAGMALAFTSGCRHAERRDCVDESGRITNDQNCQTAEQRRSSGYHGSMPYYHYLYGGSSGGHLGDAVVNGDPVPGMRSGGGIGGFFGGIMRGGFGATGSAGHGGSGGE